MSEPLRPSAGGASGTRADSDTTQLLQPEPDTGNLPAVPTGVTPAGSSSNSASPAGSAGANPAGTVAGAATGGVPVAAAAPGQAPERTGAAAAQSPERASAWAPGGSGRVATPAPAAAPARHAVAPGSPTAAGSVGLPTETPGPYRRTGGPDGPGRRGPRRARLAVKRVDPWSVLKFTFVFSLALLIVLVVAVAVLYAVLEGMGVFDSINVTLQDLTSTAGGAGTVDSIQVLFSFNRIVGGAALLGAINVVLVTALATLAAFLYNLCADLVGGLEVTLSERE